MLPDEWQISMRSPGQALLSLRLEPQLLYFQGHFPKRALLPGVAQLDLALALADAVFKVGRDPGSIQQLKFSRPLFPGDTLALALRYEQASGRLWFNYYIAARPGLIISERPGVAASCGRLTYR